MENQPIDDLNFIQPNSRKNNPVVKVVTIVLCIICLIFSFIYFRDIYDLISDYFLYRHKDVVVFAVDQIIAAVSISSIPLTAYLAWRKKFNKQGFVSYLILLIFVLFLFLVVCLVGIEVIFAFSKTSFAGSWSVLYPPIPHFCFNLLFILDGLLTFLVFHILSSRKKRSLV